MASSVFANTALVPLCLTHPPPRRMGVERQYTICYLYRSPLASCTCSLEFRIAEILPHQRQGEPGSHQQFRPFWIWRAVGLMGLMGSQNPESNCLLSFRKKKAVASSSSQFRLNKIRFPHPMTREEINVGAV